jgi:Xaa-Pro aminopeptidase
MREMDRIARDAIERGDYEPGSLEPQARAVAVFAAWIAALSAAGGRERGRELSAGATGHGIGLEVLALMASGKL